MEIVNNIFTMKEMFNDNGLEGQNHPNQQYIISSLMFYIYNNTDDRIEAIPELKVKVKDEEKDNKYKIPDIVVCHNNFVIFIEICKKTGVFNDVKKVRLLMDSHNYKNMEGFVFDYERKKWYKVNNKGKEEDNKSELLGIDFPYNFKIITE